MDTMPDKIAGEMVVEKISEGGHAIVYKTWCLKLGKHYALKLMKTDASDIAGRFETEAVILAQLDHPNITRIYTSGEFNGRPYIKMDFIDGDDLGKIISEKGRIPPVITCEIILQIAHALKYVHNLNCNIYAEDRQGIIHRDIKPENIIIDKNGNSKLIDFGIAKVDKLSIHTSSFSFIGTPNYMPPEQLNPEPDQVIVDHRIDIYGLGCVMYECLTGVKQFKSDTVSGLVTIKVKNNYDMSLLKKYPKKIRRIISKSTSADIYKRYPSIDRMIVDLEKYLNRYYVTDQSIQHFIQTGETVQIKKKINILPVVLTSILLISSVIIFWQFNRDSTVSPDDISIDTTTTGITKSVSDTQQGSMVLHNDDTKSMKYKPTPKNVKRKPIIHKNSGYMNKNTTKLSNADIAELFNKKHFRRIVSILKQRDIDRLNDSLFLLFCGSLLSVDILQMSKIVMSKPLEDAYQQYLWGRYMMSKNKWDLANDRLLLSLSKRSIISFRKDACFYLTISSFNKYKNIPNINNRQFFLTNKKAFMDEFCSSSDTNDEMCAKINELSLISKD